jgi:hypothetical protein
MSQTNQLGEQLLGQEQQMQQMMMILMMEMMQMMSGGGLGGSSGSGAVSSLPSTYGGSSGGSSGGSGSGGASGATTSPTAGGGSAVDIAKAQIGKNAQDVQMGNYTHAGGATNDCADFVSGCLANAGTFKKTAGDASVKTFQQDLIKQGFQAVSKSQAQPGDVAIILGGGVEHTELVATAGATQAIGANGTSQEKVSEQSLDWASGVTYYHKG